MPCHRLAIFVHGCFWHQHLGCPLASKPKTRQDYWGPKLASNVSRDAVSQNRLKSLGWRVAVIWECDARKPETLLNSVHAALQSTDVLDRRES